MTVALAQHRVRSGRTSHCYHGNAGDKHTNLESQHSFHILAFARSSADSAHHCHIWLSPQARTLCGPRGSSNRRRLVSAFTAARLVGFPRTTERLASLKTKAAQ